MSIEIILKIQNKLLKVCTLSLSFPTFHPGGSLQKLIKEDDHLPESCILQFGIDLVRGLHHLHSVGIIFSDIKPSKVIISHITGLKWLAKLAREI